MSVVMILPAHYFFFALKKQDCAAWQLQHIDDLLFWIFWSVLSLPSIWKSSSPMMHFPVTSAQSWTMKCYKSRFSFSHDLTSCSTTLKRASSIVHLHSFGIITGHSSQSIQQFGRTVAICTFSLLSQFVLVKSMHNVLYVEIRISCSQFEDPNKVTVKKIF